MEQHIGHLKDILTRFSKFRKMSIFSKKATFLEHVITTEGIKMDEDKISTTNRFDESKNKKELQSHIGFLNLSIDDT